MNNNNCTAYVSLRTADTFLVVASLPLKNSYFLEGETGNASAVRRLSVHRTAGRMNL